MNVFFGLDQLPKFHHAVVTIGTFDGVHLGHQVILESLKQRAASIQGETVIITFEPHPRFVISPNQQAISLLNTLDEKIENLWIAGIDNVVIVEFTKAFAALEATDYIKHFLVEKFNPHTIIIGYDHQFGKNRQGNFQLLESMKHTYHFALEEIPMQLIAQNKISSTQIREALQSGDVRKAALYLGKKYSIQGTVIEGRKQGRTLGYPTANLHIEEPFKLIPAQGVYAVYASVGEQLFKGMLNIGTNPTFTDHNQVHIEVHIFNFDQNIYGEKVKLIFVEKMRDEIKFESLAQLIEALDADKQHALNLLQND